MLGLTHLNQSYTPRMSKTRCRENVVRYTILRQLWAEKVKRWRTAFQIGSHFPAMFRSPEWNSEHFWQKPTMWGSAKNTQNFILVTGTSRESDCRFYWCVSLFATKSADFPYTGIRILTGASEHPSFNKLLFPIPIKHQHTIFSISFYSAGMWSEHRRHIAHERKYFNTTESDTVGCGVEISIWVRFSHDIVTHLELFR